MRWITAGLGLLATIGGAAAACSATQEDSQVGEGGSTGATTGPGSGGGGASASGTGGGLISANGGSSSSSVAGTGGAAPCETGAGGSTGGPEICDNGIDENQNGFIDEGCPCPIGNTQPCYLGGSLCECKVGTQTCMAAGELGGEWGPCDGAQQGCTVQLDPVCEVCGNGTDDDCDGVIDEDCVIDLMVDIDGDCVTATCPPQAPYPIACNITMAGNDPRGCVASQPNLSDVYFQEGDNCGAGHVTGTLTCSSQPGAPLDANNCPINKSQKFYVGQPNGCPAL